MGYRRRNAGIVVGAVLAAAVVGCAIVWAIAARRPPKLMPPEPAELFAKRESPDNAYFTLIEAARLLPQRPSVLQVPAEDNPQFSENYRCAPGSMGELLRISRPDDDPEIEAYIEKCAPAVAKAREALTKPYYLRAFEWADYENLFDRNITVLTGEERRIPDLARAIAGTAFWTFQSDHDAAAAFEQMVEAMKLGQLMAEDGATSISQACDAQESALERVFDVAHGADSDATLRSMLETLTSLHANAKAPVSHLEFYLRTIDNAVRFLPSTMSGDIRARFVELMFKMRRGGAVRDIAAMRDDLFSAVALPYPEYTKWERARKAAAREPSKWAFLAPPERTIQRLVERRTSLDTAYAGAELVVALERHRLASRQYPETLDALAPQYIAAIPTDPYSGAPFRYRRADSDYELCSVGRNQRDDDGRGAVRGQQSAGRGDDVVIHGSRGPE